MEQTSRQQKIDTILKEVMNTRVSGNGIPIHLWVTAETGKPGEPDFEEWLVCCTEAVDDYYAITGKRDTDSIFAEYVRKYGRRERRDK